MLYVLKFKFLIEYYFYMVLFPPPVGKVRNNNIKT